MSATPVAQEHNPTAAIRRYADTLPLSGLAYRRRQEMLKKVSAKPPVTSSSLKNRAELLKTIGVVVLILGAISASIVFWSGQMRSARQSNNQESSIAEGGWKDSTLSSEDSKGSSRTIEMNYGKVAVLIVSWLHWSEQLKPHQSLAIIIAAISTLTALSCFIVAKGWFGIR